MILFSVLEYWFTWLQVRAVSYTYMYMYSGLIAIPKNALSPSDQSERVFAFSLGSFQVCEVL